eukprot:CAMPEP_0116027314 /NCGR_PEP_ID=MMETSP0321-20121206/14553_1 /TAXON_ID=163516 /ORGANISM="Leptocylindrus danicus var. danicus, Strain B650" /LENGTH=340 /DNA_ID=CAMNT_0003500641 /DNA_START=73 /DNA_END=1095 /DNA_ORIENTATION=+
MNKDEVDQPQSAAVVEKDEKETDTTEQTNGSADHDQKPEAEAESESEEIANDPNEITSADRPSATMLSSSNPQTLISFVDSNKLQQSDFNESVYQGRALPVPAGDVLEIPIIIRGPSNSVVEYTVESSSLDISFGIVVLNGESNVDGDDADKSEDMTIFERKRVDAHLSPITGQFLIRTVPCTVLFTFDNTYSFVRSKEVTYRITITPPSMDEALASRRRRAKASLEAVQEDAKSAESRLISVISQRQELEAEIEKLQKLVMDKSKSKLVAEKEEGWLKKRLEMREVQEEMLNVRLENGWEDEGKQYSDANFMKSEAMKKCEDIAIKYVARSRKKLAKDK